MLKYIKNKQTDKQLCDFPELRTEVVRVVKLNETEWVKLQMGILDDRGFIFFYCYNYIFVLFVRFFFFVVVLSCIKGA